MLGLALSHTSYFICVCVYELFSDSVASFSYLCLHDCLCVYYM